MFSLYNKGTKNYNCHCICTIPTIEVQQLACNKICKQFFFCVCFFDTADCDGRQNSHVQHLIYFCIHFVNRVLHLFPDTSIEKERYAMNQHTSLQKDKTTTGCASVIDLFFRITIYTGLYIFGLMQKSFLVLKNKWSKLIRDRGISCGNHECCTYMEEELSLLPTDDESTNQIPEKIL